jgi:N-acetylglucosaminyldiphosphoundecaprenol N-acetyl-beta-D-mannosaminyltransferase
MDNQTAIASSGSKVDPSEELDLLPAVNRFPCANVLGIEVDALDMELTLARLAEMLRTGRKGYVCAIDVHGVMEARRDATLSEAFSNAAIRVPDGMPTAWVGRLQGHRHMQRVAGPDLMFEVLRRSEFAGYTHFLYGGEEGVAEQLAKCIHQKLPRVRIVGTCTPPFRDLTEYEERELFARIARCKPDMIWVGIGTPKQDRFMYHYLPRLKTRLMFGVGAAFNFHTGRIKDSPAWVKRAGLQWVHRLIQEPGRLWPRYLRNNPAFLWNVALQLTRLRNYPLRPGLGQSAVGRLHAEGWKAHMVSIANEDHADIVT